MTSKVNRLCDMRKLLFIVSILCFAACNNNKQSNSNGSDSEEEFVESVESNEVPTPAASNSLEEQLEDNSNANNGNAQSDERVYSDFDNYEETDDCVEGEVVYEGEGDYFIVETRKGYTVLERRSGRLSEGHKVRGELNKYRFKYLYNRNRESEVRVYIEEYKLSEESALEWMGEHDHLKSRDQEIYDKMNNRN